MYLPYYISIWSSEPRLSFSSGAGIYPLLFEGMYYILGEKWHSVAFPKDINLFIDTAKGI